MSRLRLWNSRSKIRRQWQMSFQSERSVRRQSTSYQIEWCGWEEADSAQRGPECPAVRGAGNRWAHGELPHERGSEGSWVFFLVLTEMARSGIFQEIECRQRRWWLFRLGSQTRRITLRCGTSWRMLSNRPSRSNGRGSEIILCWKGIGRQKNFHAQASGDDQEKSAKLRYFSATGH